MLIKSVYYLAFLWGIKSIKKLNTNNTYTAIKQPIDVMITAGFQYNISHCKRLTLKIPRNQLVAIKIYSMSL